MFKIKTNWIKIFIFCLLSAWVIFFFTAKIDLTTSDIGRHITNGRIFLEKFSTSGFHAPVLNTNLYSFTHPDFQFTNHHWGSGIIFYLIWQAWGFIGLSLINLLLGLVVFLGAFFIAKKYAGFYPAAFAALFAIPLLAQRHEVRPEMFSYVLTVLVFWLLLKYKSGEKNNFKILLLLPLIQLLWINLHIYFFLGFGLMGAFWISLLPNYQINFSKLKYLSLAILASLGISLINPFGLKGLLYPLQIFTNYGYPIVENKSIWFLTNYGFPEANLNLVKILTIVLIILLGVKIYQARKNFPWELGILGLLALVGAWFALRNFAILGLFGLPLLAYSFILFAPQNTKPELEVKVSLGALWLILTAILFGVNFSKIDHARGFGLVSGNLDSAQFFLQHNLTGPILNNYDIGSYLIFTLYPREKVFTDNRPEAYPIGFFQNEYIPALQDPEVWQQELKKYNFNTIFFSATDITNWGQDFLTARLKDPNWTVVHADSFGIIFSKKTTQNIVAQ
jgi:hypothetical protein